MKCSYGHYLRGRTRLRGFRRLGTGSYAFNAVHTKLLESNTRHFGEFVKRCLIPGGEVKNREGAGVKLGAKDILNGSKVAKGYLLEGWNIRRESKSAKNGLMAGLPKTTFFYGKPESP